MTNNLAAELDRFKEKIKEDKSVQVTHRQGYGGVGAIQWPVLFLIAGLAVLRIFKR